MPPMHGGWVSTVEALEFEHGRGIHGKPEPWDLEKTNGCGWNRRNGAGGESWGKKSVKVGESWVTLW